MATTDRPKLAGKKKGGKTFPRISLTDAVDYARKLVSRTHTGPQSSDVIFTGVFNSGGSRGAIRASALKQFGLMSGLAAELTATPLARGIDATPREQVPPLLVQALFNAKAFEFLFNSFKGDTASLAKLRQQALTYGVHPDSGVECAELFVESVVYAGLGEKVGDGVRLRSDIGATPAALTESESEREPEHALPVGVSDPEAAAPGASEPSSMSTANPMQPPNPPLAPAASARSVIHVNLTVDSSMDTEKLAKQLQLLRDYGAL